MSDPQNPGHILLSLEGVSRDGVGKNLGEKVSVSVPHAAYQYLVQKSEGRLSELSLFKEASGACLITSKCTTRFHF